jgi:Ca-activated chloride channel family protein
MRFERPLALVFLFLPAAWWWLRSWWLSAEMKRLRIFVRPALWDRVEISPPPPRVASRIMWCVAIALFVIAASGPVWGSGSAVIPTGGANVAIALDVSTSMATADEVPSRLGRAEAEILSLLDEMQGVRFSLILFSGQARLAVPGTLDREYLASRLPASPWADNALAPGTQLGSLVDVMAASLPEEELETCVGVVFSDGGFSDSALESAVEEARHSDLTLVTLGLGGLDSVPLPDSAGGVRTSGADTIRTALCERPLRDLAERTGGFYARMSETGDLPGLLEDLMESREALKAEEVAGGAEGRSYQIFLAAGLLAAGAAMILERRGH